MDNNDEDIPDLLDSDLRDMPIFYKLYLIGKMLGEAVSIKFLIAKCLIDWQASGEVNFVDMGIGFV